MTSPRDGSKRKYPSIDLIALYSRGDHKLWNLFLTKALAEGDMNGLVRVLYGIQAGMAEASSKNMATPQIVDLFVRLQRSIEQTAKKIFRKKYPHPLDDPNYKGPTDITFHEVKKKRDAAFEAFIRRASF